MTENERYLADLIVNYDRHIAEAASTTLNKSPCPSCCNTMVRLGYHDTLTLASGRKRKQCRNYEMNQIKTRFVQKWTKWTSVNWI